MGQTHLDSDSGSFLERLKERAKQLEGRSVIAAGKPSEEPLAVWSSCGIEVRHMPDDEQGILRISIGGGHTPIPLNYCTIRGSVGDCIGLLEKALKALRDSP